MAATIVSFRWLEILEKEFDKNFVDLDLLIEDLDAEEPDFVHSARQKLAGLSSCFAQLTHKAQTIFQNSAKVEAELVDLRTELVNSKTRQEILEEESRNLVLQLHSLQLDRLPPNQNPEQYKEKIETALKLSPSKSSYSEEITFRNNSEVKKFKNELLQYQSENIILRNSILALHSEVYGARLAAKYLDKELAGRIQQLQLLGREMRTDVRDKLWRQLESEILLHRHKTVIRACRNRTNHEFISADSRILSLNRSNDSYLKTLRQGDSILNYEENLSRRKKHEKMRKVEGVPKYQSVESLSHKNIIMNSNSNCNKNCNTNNTELSKNGNFNNNNSIEDSNNNINTDNDKDNDNDNGNTNKIVEKISEKNDCNHTKSLEDVLKVDRVNSLNGTPEKIKNNDVIVENFVRSEDKVLDLSEKDTTGKADEENFDKKNIKSMKEIRGKSVSSEGEEFLCMVGEKRTVFVKRQSGQGLGISITGGREHGVPILISELEVGGPAHECKNLFVGDAILKVNDMSLENTSHFEAVKILTNLDTNNVKLLVQFIAVDTDEENSLSEDLYGYRYRFFDTEVMDSSDALGLHPLHSNSAHTPTAPRTPDLNRSSHRILNCCSPQGHSYKPQSSFLDGSLMADNKTNEKVETPEEKFENLIDIDSETTKEEVEKLEIDLFGFRFQTNMSDVKKRETENLLDDFVVKKAESVKVDNDLIQIEINDSKAPTTIEKKFEYVDEKIFSGLDDHSILDNIIKSFSEDDFSYLDGEREKNVTSDSGLEVCLSGSDNDAEKLCLNGEKNYSNDWGDNAEKVELKTLQQIFDRSFSSNLSSPRGSTSFDDDILSTEHSDEKSHSALSFKNKLKDIRSTNSQKKIQKYIPKNVILTEDVLKKSFSKAEDLINQKTELVNGKKIKRGTSESVKRNKPGRKSKEMVKKEVKIEKKKKELEGDAIKIGGDSHKKREVNFKITDRFEENLIEYNAKSFDVNQISSNKIDNQVQNIERGRKVETFEELGDELEETRKLSRRYGLKIPGKGVKVDSIPNTVVSNGGELISPERCIKVLENHFKHFKPVLEGSALKQNEKESRSKVCRYSRYESFGDPDFGTPV